MAPLCFDERIYEATPARLAEVLFDADKWGEVREGARRVELFVKPKELAGE